MVVLGVDEHLGLVLEPTKCLRVEDPVPVPLERGAVGVGRLFDRPPRTLHRERGGRRQQVALLFLARLAGQTEEWVGHGAIVSGTADAVPG